MCVRIDTSFDSDVIADTIILFNDIAVFVLMAACVIFNPI